MRYLYKLTGLAITFCLACMSTVASAHEPGGALGHDGIMVTRHFTGLWDQVDQEAQGITLQVVEQSDGSRRAVAYWFTYGDDRKTAWFVAIGDLVENRIEFELYDSTDVGFLQAAIAGNDSVQSIGTMAMIFESCDLGLVTFESSHPEVGVGSFRIERLTDVMNTHCSGGISDDMHADMMPGEQRIEFAAARDGITGSGYAMHENFPGHSEFEIHVHGLPDGHYHLFVAAQDRGEISVHQGIGRLEFVSPAEDGKYLLNFDPRGMQIEVHDASGAVLSSFGNMFVADDYRNGGYHDNNDHNYGCQNGPGSGHGMNNGMGGPDCVDDGEYFEIQAGFENMGVIAEAEGSANWKMNSHRIQFSVEIENIPVGIYTLNVGGRDVGVIDAIQMQQGVYGRISFRDPEAYGMRHLDFDPRGEMVKVLQGENVILQILIPTE